MDNNPVNSPSFLANWQFPLSHYTHSTWNISIIDDMRYGRAIMETKRGTLLSAAQPMREMMSSDRGKSSHGRLEQPVAYVTRNKRKSGYHRCEPKNTRKSTL